MTYFHQEARKQDVHKLGTSATRSLLSVFNFWLRPYYYQLLLVKKCTIKKYQQWIYQKKVSAVETKFSLLNYILIIHVNLYSFVIMGPNCYWVLHHNHNLVHYLLIGFKPNKCIYSVILKHNESHYNISQNPENSNMFN